MIRAVFAWLAWLQDHDIEGPALSFGVCQLTLAISAGASGWAAANDAALILFLPTVFLAAFFLRFLEACFVLLTALVATWYFIVPPQDSFALSAGGAIELGIFVLSSCLLVIGAVRMRSLLRRGVPRHSGRMLKAEPDLMVDG